jgi:hypothetical protein
MIFDGHQKHLAIEIKRFFKKGKLFKETSEFPEFAPNCCRNPPVIYNHAKPERSWVRAGPQDFRGGYETKLILWRDIP